MCGLINKANCWVQIRDEFVLSVKSLGLAMHKDNKKKKQKLIESNKLCLVS